MKSQILSLNIGHPAEISWEGKSAVTSMHKTSVPGPLIVHLDHIEGDSFSNPVNHGTIDSVLYMMGQDALDAYGKLLGKKVDFGDLGENLSLDALDETKISVGDIFQIGEVVAQATFPRIPCGKVNIRMQHPKGQQLLKDVGRSGIYFRILKPGKIYLQDQVARIEESKYPFLISELYQIWNQARFANAEIYERAVKNGAFMQKALDVFRPPQD